ncbi:MAG: plasmid pRiA4b ORF-3 family protein [Vicinamibacterales bacterium]
MVNVIPATVVRFRSRRQPSSPAPKRQALQFLVVLLGTSPLIWRRIEVVDTCSFWDLHVAIQDAMGWSDSHLHEFRIAHPQRGTMECFGIPDPDFPEEHPRTADWEVPLAGFFNWDTAGHTPSASYLYDFGDGWQHLVTLEAVGAVGRGRLPRCVDGERACPPEDCGGLHGFDAFVAAVSDPEHPEHTAMLEWYGRPYDPGAFDAAKVRFSDPRRRLNRMLRGQQ